MKFLRHFFTILLAFSLCSIVVSCAQDDDVALDESVFEPNNPDIPKIMFTSENASDDDFSFWIKTTDFILIDWGKGITDRYMPTSENGLLIKGQLAGHTVKIYTNDGATIKYLDLQGKRIKNIDFKNSVGLETLLLNNNKVTTLDLSKNTSLKKINIEENNFKTEELDKTLQSLHKNNTVENPGTITIGDGNDGNAKPTTSIVEGIQKLNWKVIQD